MTEKDLNVISIVQQLRKLKAGMSAIIGNDPIILGDAQKIYYNESMILQKKCGGSELKRRSSFLDHDNKFMEFMKRDEREKIKEIAESIQT